eukprot:scaffold68814_cov72-Phaeocystis_antarctica.AAC.2
MRSGGCGCEDRQTDKETRSLRSGWRQGQCQGWRQHSSAGQATGRAAGEGEATGEAAGVAADGTFAIEGAGRVGSYLPAARRGCYPRRNPLRPRRRQLACASGRTCCPLASPRSTSPRVCAAPAAHGRGATKSAQPTEWRPKLPAAAREAAGRRQGGGAHLEPLRAVLEAFAIRDIVHD